MDEHPLERRKPVPRNRRPAIRKASKSMITEIAGTILAAAIFAAAVLTSAFGMSGGFDDQSAIVLAGAIENAR